jgi:hypothetical protein
MFFVPAPILEQEPPIETIEDVFKVLDKYVETDYMTAKELNIGFVKSQCFQILQNYYQAGKMCAFQNAELKALVDIFLVDRFWLGYETVVTAKIPPHLEPENWSKEE